MISKEIKITSWALLTGVVISAVFFYITLSFAVDDSRFWPFGPPLLFIPLIIARLISSKVEQAIFLTRCYFTVAAVSTVLFFFISGARLPL